MKEIKYHPAEYQVEKDGKWIRWPFARLRVPELLLKLNKGRLYCFVDLPEEGLTLMFYQVRIGERLWNVDEGWINAE